MVNFVLAFFIYSLMLFYWGESYLPAENLTYGIHADSLAREIGLRHGDHIVSLDNREVDDFQQIVPTIALDNIRTIQVMRDGALVNIDVPEGVVPQLLAGTPFIDLRFPFIIGGFPSGSVAKEAGFEEGDKVLELNDQELPFFYEFREQLMNYRNQEIVVTVERDETLIDVPVTVPEEGLLGVAPVGLTQYFELRTMEYSLFASIPAGISKGMDTFSSYLKQLKMIFSPQTGAYKSLGGFITIGSIFQPVWDWQAFWSITAFLSIVLAIMNVLPIPALDGGHVMFLLYEMVSGRKPSDKFMEYAQLTGMLLLLSLILYANGNDIIRLFR
jgi:regulator of sigma E protease